MRRFLFLNLFFTLFFFMIIPSICYASENVNLQQFKNEQRKLILNYFYSGNYFSSIAETKRFIAYFPKKSNLKDISFFVQANYYLGKQYKTVIFNINQSKSKLDFKSLLLLSESYQKLGFFNEASLVFKKYNFFSLSSPREKDAFFLAKLKPLFLNNQFEKSLEEIDKIKKVFSSEKINSLQAMVLGYAKINLKSPALSIALSAIIPGAGQLYSGKYVAAILSFVGIAATAVSSYFLYDCGEYGLAYTMMFFSVVFYGGNLYSAYSSAIDTNRRLLKNFSNKIISKYYHKYSPTDGINIGRIFN